MKTILNSAEFIHIPEYSFYNHNFYRNIINEKIILEETDDGENHYWWVNEDDMINHRAHKNAEYIGVCYSDEFHIPTEARRKRFHEKEYTFEFDSSDF